MNFSKGVGILLLILLAGFVILSLFDFRLGVLFVILWIDKTVISAFGVIRYFGVELTTVVGVILGILYGPWFAFIFLLVLIPALHGIKYVCLPLPQPEWPLFIPSPYNIVDALGAAVAGLLAPFSFFVNVFATAIAKDVFFALAEKFMISKPVNVLAAITSVAFNVFVGYPFGLLILGFLGHVI